MSNSGAGATIDSIAFLVAGHVCWVMGFASPCQLPRGGLKSRSVPRAKWLGSSCSRRGEELSTRVWIGLAVRGDSIVVSAHAVVAAIGLLSRTLRGTSSCYGVKGVDLTACLW